MRHKHRIKPGHLGGEYTSENVVELSVLQHAMWHFASWQLWGRKEDEIAWRGLAGIVGREEVVKEATKMGGRKTQECHPEQFRDNMDKARDLNPNLDREARDKACTLHPDMMRRGGKRGGKKTHEAHPEMASQRGKRTHELHPEMARHRGRRMHELHPEIASENGRKMAEKSNKQKWECLVTGKISNSGGLTSHQKARGIDTSLRVRLE